MPAAREPRRQPLRVLHIAQSIAGGVASFLEEVAGYQTATFGRENVRFLIPAGSEGHLADVDPAQLLTFAPTTRRPAALLNFARAADKAIHEFGPDIVHLHSSFAGAAVRLRRDWRESGVRMIYCPHGWAFGMEISAPKKRAYAAIERALARRTDLILCNSQAEYDLALASGLPAEKMRVVRNGIGWEPPPKRKRRSGPIRLGFIGRHDRQKGLDILLDTIRRFPLAGMHFDVIGDKVLKHGGDEDAAALANITFHGWLPRAKTLQLFDTVDALVMPSRWDAAPIVATEAMRAGVPVIASNRGGLPEIVNHGVGGYVFDLDDRDALGKLLQRLDRADLAKLGRSARARWEEEYLSDRMNELTCDAYDDVVSGRRTRRPPNNRVRAPSARRVDCAVSG